MNLNNIIFGKDNDLKKDFLKDGIFGKSFYILLLAALIPTLHVYFGSQKFFLKQIEGIFENPYFSDLYSVIYLFVSTLILMGIIPVILVRFIFKNRLIDYGVKIGDWKLGIKSIIILYPIITILFLLPAAYQNEIRDFYPLFRPALNDLSTLVMLEFIRGIVYYLAWEFFFRGFLLFGLKETVGSWIAILIQTIPSCLWHIGYPTGEIIMSIPAGIMFGIIAIRTKSILYPFILHWLIGFTTSFLIYITK